MNEAAKQESANGTDKIGMLVFLAILILLGVFWTLGPAWKLAFLMAEVALISVVIWQACDPFADAAQWVGDILRLPGSVRGATLDAVASSMPELFSGIFFVLVAVLASGDSQADRVLAGAEGYGATIATCAGSAVYNMILIPACCALVISSFRKNRPTIDIENEVISRDGIWFVGCELLLILFLSQRQMYWWMAFVFMGVYVFYVGQLYFDARSYQRDHDAVKEKVVELPKGTDPQEIVEQMKAEGLRVTEELVYRVKREIARGDGDEEEHVDSAGVFFGFFDVKLDGLTAAAVLTCSTLVAAAACYFLVEATRGTAHELGVPTFFVAVILAAAASSVPDTFLSIGASKRGDDSGAVSNAFGSNIFDICICMSVPLLVNSYLVGWQPVELTQDGRPIPGLVGLQILLVVLTIATLAIIWHNRQLTRNKAIVLCGLYGVFIAYAVLGSLGILF